MKAGSLEIEILTNLARVQQEMAEIKRAVGGAMDNVGGAMDKARASTERYAASIEAEAAKFGKASSEIKKMEIAANAAAAEAQGFTELAQRIRDAGAALETAKTQAAAMAAQHERDAAAAREAAAAQGAYVNGLAALRAQINPLAAEEARLAAQIDIANQAFARGDMETQEYIRTIGVLEKRQQALQQSGRQVTASAGQQRAGMQQLSYQIGDVTQQFALGTPAMTIFAQQGGQVFQALGMMQKEAKGFIGFMGGPWGAVIMGGAMVVGMLTAKLFDNKAATEAAEKSMKTFQDRQSDIANFIDTTTGALKEQNKTLVLNAILTRQANILANEKAISDQRAEAFRIARIQRDMNPGYAGTSSVGSPIISQLTDPRVEAIIKQANGDVAKLADGMARLARVSGDKRFGQAALAISNVAGAAIVATRENEKYSREIEALSGNTRAYANSTTSVIERQVAAAVATTASEKAQTRLNDVRARASSIDGMAAGAAKDRALAQYRADLQAATIAERAAKASDKSEKQATSAANSAQRHAEALARAAGKHEAALSREASAMDANARSGIALAAAFLGAGKAVDGEIVALGAASIAEARHRAAAEATRKGLAEESQTRRQLANMAADAAAQAAKTVYQLRTETTLRDDLSDQLEAGKISLGAYNEELKQAQAIKPLADLQAAAKVMGLNDAYDILTRTIEAMTVAMNENRAAQARAAFDQARQQGEDEIERLQLENKLIGANNEQRAVELAMLQKKQQLRSSDLSPAQQAVLVAQAGEIARQAERNNVAQDVHNRLLSAQLDILDTIDQRARSLGDTLSDAFGRPGEAIGKLLTDFTGYARERQRLQDQLDKQVKEAGANAQAVSQARAAYERDATTAEMQHISSSLTAFKDLFSQKSGMYRTLTKFEQIYGALQLANSAKALAIDIALTAKSIANSLARGAADAAAGAAKIFASLGPLGFPVVAVMVATLAALGLKGLHGGGKGPTIPTAEDVQKSQGTGSVLGDSGAKSDSIARALDLVAKNTNKDLEYSSEMVRSLRAIESNIGGLASQIAQQMGVSGGAFDTSGLGLGSKTSIPMGTLPLTIGPIDAVLKHIPVIGDVIDGILKTLFGTKKTVTLIDQGFEFTAQSVGDIVNSGVVGDIYQALQTTKKSKFFGISTGTKTSNSTQTSALDSGFTDQIGLLIGSLRDGIVSAAKVIGIDGATAMIDAFQLNLGKISLKDLKGEDLEKAIAAVFSKAADDMAGAVAPGLSEFQKVGEGLFETLSRLARDYQVVDVTLSSIGKTLGAVGVASIGMRENLIDLFGGLDNFTDLTGKFAEAFLSEAERMAPVQAAVTKAMADLGLAGIGTKDQFKQAVLGLDLTTEAGQQMYAQLLTIAPAFAKVQDYLASLNGTVEDTAKTAQQLAEIEKQRRTLEIQLMEASGDAAGALAAKRSDDLAAMDESLRALQQQVWAAQEAADAAKALAQAQEEAARAAEAIAGKRHDLEIQLMEAQGNAAGALAARRADELAAMDESLRALQQQVWATQDAAAASDALSQVQMTAADIATKRRDLEIQLMEATGDAAGALAARRSDELAALDPLLHALQLQLWAAQDAAEANQALANIQQTAAEIARTRHDLEIRLMEAQGDAAGALAARRADELAAIDASLRPLLELIYATEDAAAADAALNGVRQTAAEIAKTRHDLEIRLMEAQGDAAGVLAARRADELAAIDPTLRALLQQIYATEDAAAAETALNGVRQTAAEIAKTQHDLELRLMEAQGDAAGALARRRQDELASVDPTLRALLQQIYATEDAAAAETALNGVRQTAAEIAKTQHDLELRLLEASGDTIGALTRRREDEMASIDASLRPLLQQIYAAEDAATANQALADAQAAAAQAAEDAAQRAAELAKARSGLEIDLMRALGDEAGAMAAERALQLAGTDDSLKALQQQVWAAQDAATAQQALADAQAAAAQAADEAARAQQELADKRTDLEIRLLRATGNEIGATAMERSRELAQIDPTLRALMMQVYAAEDAKAAMDEQNQSMGDMAKQYRTIAANLRDYKASLAGAAALTAEEATRAAAGQFAAVFAKARLGDADALGGLQGAGQDFLQAARASAGSALEYKRSVGSVADAIGQAIAIADNQASDAERQLSAMGRQIDLLTLIDGGITSVHDAILAAADRGALSIDAPDYGALGGSGQGADIGELKDEIRALKEALKAPMDATAASLRAIDKRTEAQDDGGYVRITTDGQPIEVTT